MKVDPVVRQETLRMTYGMLAMTALMLLIFLLLGRLDITVILGALLGNAYSILNFFLMALSVQKAAEEMNGVRLPPEEPLKEGEDPDEKEKSKELSPQAKAARKKMQLSYTGRMLLLVCVGALAVIAPCFNAYAALIPMFFPRIVIFIRNFIENKAKKEA